MIAFILLKLENFFSYSYTSNVKWNLAAVPNPKKTVSKAVFFLQKLEEEVNFKFTCYIIYGPMTSQHSKDCDVGSSMKKKECINR